MPESRHRSRTRWWVRVTAAAAVALAALATSASPSHAAAGQLVSNGAFDSGAVDPWWHSETTTVAVDDGRLRVEVPAGTGQVWEAMVGQSGVALTGGHEYVLAFDAHAVTLGTPLHARIQPASASAAATGTPLHARVQPESSPSTTVVHRQMALTATAQRYEVAFTAGQSITDGQLVFQLGGQASDITVFLDNVSLTATGGGSGSPIDMTNGFYVDPNSNPAVWVRNHGGDSRAPAIQATIASKPMARWFGDWNADIAAAVSSYVSAAEAADKLPILVAYNMYHRDCGGPSGGGATTPDAYRAWLSAFAAAIGDRPAIVVIEPDATAQFDCLNAQDRTTRLQLLTYATEQVRDHAPNTWAYLDAGNANWPSVAAMASRLPNAGLSNVRGFSVNVSNFYTTTQSINYANALNTAMGRNAPFVIDTSRNGNGSNGDWCNPPGRRLGTPTQVGGGTELLLWVKTPGDSDGNTGLDCDPSKPPAGQFSPALAMELIGEGGPPSSFPDATNTGVPPGTTLQTSGGLTITPGNTVIDGLDINGLSRCGPTTSPSPEPGIRCGEFHVIRMHNDHHGLLVEDVDIELDDAVVENNDLNGGAYTIYVGVGTTSPNVIIRDNRFGRDNLFGLLSATEPQVRWTNNVWHHTGEPAFPSKRDTKEEQ